MISDYKPIQFTTDPSFEEIEIYFAHDIHKGNEFHNEKKWNSFKKQILEKPNRFVIFAGDCFETALINCKSDVYSALSPQIEKEWFTEELAELKDRTICLCPGNHEARFTKICGIQPLYDCAFANGLQNVYRPHFAFVDIGVGSGGHGQGKQLHYVGFITHRLRDCKGYNGADFIEGIDFAAYGHDHCPKDIPRGKLLYDNKNKAIVHKNVDVIDSGAFLTYGGYAVDGGYRPSSEKCYKLILDGRNKSITTVGFYC